MSKEMDRVGSATSERRRKPNKEILRGLEAEQGKGSTLAQGEKCLIKSDRCPVFIDSEVA